MWSCSPQALQPYSLLISQGFLILVQISKEYEKIISDKIRFEITVTEGTIVYSGTVEGNTMKGKVDFGSYGDGPFTGNKKP